MSSSFCLASSRAFCLSAICCLYWASCLSQSAGVAHAVAGIGVHGGGANLVFALQHVEFARRQIDLIFLRGDLSPHCFHAACLAASLAACSSAGDLAELLSGALSSAAGLAVLLGSFGRSLGVA